MKNEIEIIKKVIVVLLLILGSISIYATSNQFSKTEKFTVMVFQDEYKQVNISLLPTAIKDAVSRDFKTAAIYKAYINEVYEYKLLLAKNNFVKTVYITETGSWINK